MSASEASSARAFLAVCGARGLRLGLDTSHALLAALGHPERAYPVLLVAGTNGKGSVVATVESVLRAAGLRTGRFTSPALRVVEEHVALDGIALSAPLLEHAIDVARAACARAHLAPSAFELLSAVAFWTFREQAVDVAVVEVGLGGRDDATNACEPLASAIVSVDFDHEDVLGQGLPAIARAKAGVLRAGRVTVLGPLPAVARAVVQQAAARIGAHLVDAMAGVSLEEQPSARGQLIATTAQARYPGLRPLPGAHQHDNLRVALALLEAAAAGGLRWDARALAQGVAATDWPGRLQRIAGRPPLLLDGAHNPAAARALASCLEHEPAYVLLLAVMRDKDIPGLVRPLCPGARAVVVTRAPSAGVRAADAHALGACVGALTSRCHVEDDLEHALALARELAGPTGLVVVAGSLALVGDVLGLVEVLGAG